MPMIEDIALFDMDGTLCDYEKSLREELEKLRSPEEIPYTDPIRDAPPHIQNRSDMIRASEEWWANLPRFQLGWDVLEIAQGLGYDIMILTQGPRRNPASWSGKKRWIDENLGPDLDVTITRNKGAVYGKVLVDDFSVYVEKWLTWRPRGTVIMPANDSNQDFEHEHVIRYDGTNLEQVKEALRLTKNRQPGEYLNLDHLR